MIEIWKDVVGYEEYFKVSNKGGVFSKRTNKTIKQCLSYNGYCIFTTRIGGRKGKIVNFRVHRLVAIAFIPNPENKLTVNHKDGNKLNNYVGNLEWATHAEQSYHAIENKLQVPISAYLKPNAKLSKEDVAYIRSYYVPYSKEFGCRALAKKYSVAHSEISRIISGKLYKY